MVHSVRDLQLLEVFGEFWAGYFVELSSLVRCSSSRAEALMNPAPTTRSTESRNS
jgi:hypothetical protein